jgi:hypothetical protein
MRTITRAIAFLLLMLSVLPVAGCAVAHQYPAYRGKVLELGTDRPIEGAGVLAVYRMTIFYWIERNSEYLGYQAVLTDKDGKFEVPAKFFSAFRPLASFDSDVTITIYKAGYGNFPGSFGSKRVKQGKTDPALVDDKLPPDNVVTFWLPKLETAEERKEHDNLYSVTSSILFEVKPFPPEGLRKDQFLPPKYR